MTTPHPLPAARPDGTARIALSGMPDDRRLLRAAAELTRDLHRPRPLIYWTDFLGSAALGYGALLGAILSRSFLPALGFGLVAVVALYRATLFIHEITHLDHSRLPGFRVAWNLLLGVPTMLPSFLYEGIHIIHHTRTRYGTAADPEYLPLALMRPWSLPLFLLAAVLMPFILLLRFGVVGPVSMLFPGMRRVVVARFSGLQMNPRFERRPPQGTFARQWFREEFGASLVAIALIATTATGLLPLRAFLTIMAVLAGVAVLNQLRTLVAHLWENDGAALTVTAQYLDSTNVPGGVWPLIWAPVGLRFHALHHLLPSLPYHALAEAHRRLLATLGDDSTYTRATYPTLHMLLARIAARTMTTPRHP